jgi:thioredoxin reductase
VSRVVVVGGGPAGLAAAVDLRGHGIDDVVVLEREPVAGGVPRHCDHSGFGLRDLHRLLGGPAYAARRVALAARAGVDVRTQASVVDWSGPTAVVVTSPRGIECLAADAVLLATGCRERPRSARLVPGTRPAGVFTTGAVQQLVHLGHVRVGRRAVVVGAEHVSFSAVLTLREAGCETIAMVTELPSHQTYGVLAWFAAGRLGVPILASSRVAEIRGRARVDAVVLDDGRVLACDTVVFTGDWTPDHELARRGGLEMDAGARGPRVDQGGHTSVTGVFAAGNLVHAAETADVAAIGGRATGPAIARYLRTGVWPVRVPVVCAAPLRWAWPHAIDPTAPPPAGMSLRTSELVRAATLVAEQDGRTLWRGRRRRLVPNRSIRAGAAWTASVDARGGPVRWRLA